MKLVKNVTNHTLKAGRLLAYADDDNGVQYAKPSDNEDKYAGWNVSDILPQNAGLVSSDRNATGKGA
jgi:hypothetical protein